MKFADRLRIAAGIVTGRRIKSAPYAMATWHQGSPQFDLINYATYVTDGYQKNTLVYACIREIAQSAAEPGWLAYRGEDLAPDHALQALLNTPNPYFSSFELWELALIYMNLDGNAFILKERSKAGHVVALWPMRPDLVNPVPGPNGDLLGYSYWVGTQRTAWLPEDVIHLKYPNPGDDLEGLGRGWSPLAVAARETDVDNSATSFLKKFFDNAAVPYGLLKSKQQLADTEVKRIRARIHEQYVGEDNWHDIMILDADAEYQRLGLNMDEMAMPDLRSISESRICMSFGVPPILIGAKVGLDRSTFSNYGEARRSFWEQTLSPTYRRIRDKLNTQLAPEFGDKALRIECDLSRVQALQESRDAKFLRSQSGVSGGWMTVNDARLEVGLAPVTEGDVFLRGLATIEVPVSLAAGRKMLPVHQVKGRAERVRGYERLFASVARTWEPKFKARAADLLADESAAIRARLERRKATIDYLALGTDIDEVLRSRTDHWRDGFIPLFQALIGAQGDILAATFGIDFNLQSPEVQAFIRDYAFQFAQKISATAADEIRAIIGQAQREGWDILKTMGEIAGKYSQWTTVRAEMIARSETIRSSNAGAVAAYRQAGVTQKEWLVTGDNRLCEFCAPMAGRVVGIETNFYSLGDTVTTETGGVLSINYEHIGYPPLHPNCRCAILPVVGE